TVDDVVIIAKGRLVRSSSLAELVADARPRVRVAGPDTAGLAALAAARGWAVSRGAAVPVGAPGAPAGLELLDVTPAEVGAAAFAAGLELHELSRLDAGLEALFLEMVGDADATAPGQVA